MGATVSRPSLLVPCKGMLWTLGLHTHAHSSEPDASSHLLQHLLEWPVLCIKKKMVEGQRADIDPVLQQASLGALNSDGSRTHQSYECLFFEAAGSKTTAARM